MKATPKFSMHTQINIITVAFALRNYIRTNSRDEIIFTMLDKHPDYRSNDKLTNIDGNIIT